MTIGVEERALWAATEVSYEKASEFLKRFNGLEVSRNKMHRERLREEALRRRGEGRRRVKELIEYVRGNHDWIENIPLVGGYGSGPIEKTVDITVKRKV